MKKIFLTFICAIAALSVSAQRASSSSSSFFSTEKSDQPITFSIRGGVNFSNASFSDGDLSVSPKGHTGFHAGVAVDFPILQSFYLQSGLYYTVKGFEIGFADTKANPAYLEIPILASYRHNFSEGVQLQFNFGPYFAYGVGGNFKTSSYGKENFFGDYCTRFDMGLQVGAGFTFARHYYLGVAYEFGLVNIAKDNLANARANGGAKMKNKNFFISAGYQF